MDTNSDLIELIIPTNHSFKRLDHFIAENTEDLSRSQIKNFLERGLIQGKDQQGESVQLYLKKIPTPGTLITIEIPIPVESELVPQDIPLEILYEDEHLIVINKEQGLVIHPAPGHPDGTLVNAVLFHCPDLKGVGEERRPGIVHRLDRGTSGVMIVAKTQKAHQNLVKMFSEHDLVRQYECLTLKKNIKPWGVLKSQIGRARNDRKKMSTKTQNGKQAITHYGVLEEGKRILHIECQLETGRTHQIRVHLTELLGVPILMDPLYGNPKKHLNHVPDDYKEKIADCPFPFLHAKYLKFKHPITGEELEFSTSPPPLFQEILDHWELF